MTEDQMAEGIDTAALLKRRFVWDILPCKSAPEFMAKLGLNPSSQDVAEMEHQESHERLNQLTPIIEAVDMMATSAGRVAAQALLVGQGVGIDTDQAESTIKGYAVISTAVSRSVIAGLLEAGLIKLGGVQ